MLSECAKLVEEIWSGKNTPELRVAEQKLLEFQTAEEGWALACDCLRSDNLALILLGGQILNTKIIAKHAKRPPLDGLLKLIVEALNTIEKVRTTHATIFYLPARNKTVALVALLYKYAENLQQELPTEIITKAIESCQDLNVLSNIFQAISEIPETLAVREPLGCFEVSVDREPSAFTTPYWQAILPVFQRALTLHVQLLQTEQNPLMLAISKFVGCHVKPLRAMQTEMCKTYFESICRIYKTSSKKDKYHIVGQGGLGELMAGCLAALSQYGDTCTVAGDSLLILFVTILDSLTFDITSASQNAVSMQYEDAVVAEATELSRCTLEQMDHLVGACAELFSPLRSLPALSREVFIKVISYMRSSGFTADMRLSNSVTESLTAIIWNIKSCLDDPKQADKAAAETLLCLLTEIIGPIWLDQILAISIHFEDDADLAAYTDSATDVFTTLLHEPTEPMKSALRQALEKYLWLTKRNLSLRDRSAHEQSNIILTHFWKGVGAALALKVGNVIADDFEMKVVIAIVDTGLVESVVGMLDILATYTMDRSLQLKASAGIMTPYEQDWADIISKSLALVTNSFHTRTSDCLHILESLAVIHRANCRSHPQLLSAVTALSGLNLQQLSSQSIFRMVNATVMLGQYPNLSKRVEEAENEIKKPSSPAALFGQVVCIGACFYYILQLVSSMRDSSSLCTDESIFVRNLANRLCPRFFELSKEFLVEPQVCSEYLRRTGSNIIESYHSLIGELLSRDQIEEITPAKLGRLIYYNLLCTMSFGDVQFEPYLHGMSSTTGFAMHSSAGYIGLVESLFRDLQGAERKRLATALIHFTEQTQKFWGAEAVCSSQFLENVDIEPFSDMLRGFFKTFSSLTVAAGKSWYRLPPVSEMSQIRCIKQCARQIIISSKNGELLRVVCNAVLLIADGQAPLNEFVNPILTNYLSWNRDGLLGAVKVVQTFVYDNQTQNHIDKFINDAFRPWLKVMKSSSSYLANVDDTILSKIPQCMATLRGRLAMQTLENIWRVHNGELSTDDLAFEIDAALARWTQSHRLQNPNIIEIVSVD